MKKRQKRNGLRIGQSTVLGISDESPSTSLSAHENDERLYI